MQEASVLKPYALSLLLLPSADRCFTCQWSQVKLLCITDRYFTCQCMKNWKKIFNADRSFTCQAMKFYFFSGKSLFFDTTDKWNTCQQLKAPTIYCRFFYSWQVFFLSVHEFSLLFGKPDKHFACQLIFLWLVDKQKACQCSFSTPLRRKKLVS